MTGSIETQISEAEEQLRLAMLASDVAMLGKLLAAELIFTNHLGHVLSRQDDLDAHRSGIVKIEQLTPSEQHIQLVGDVAIVSVCMHIVGSYAGNHSEADLRFTRVWAPAADGGWQVVAGHASVVA